MTEMHHNLEISTRDVGGTYILYAESDTNFYKPFHSGYLQTSTVEPQWLEF